MTTVGKIPSEDRRIQSNNVRAGTRHGAIDFAARKDENLAEKKFHNINAYENRRLYVLPPAI